MTGNHHAAPKVLTIERHSGPALISADLHGHWDDFARLRQIFLESLTRGEAPLWISVGDWVHGPDETVPSLILDSEGAPLYDYPDRSPQILRALFALMDRYPGQILSLLGNHEYAQVPRRRGGPPGGGAISYELSEAEQIFQLSSLPSWPWLA